MNAAMVLIVTCPIYVAWLDTNEVTCRWYRTCVFVYCIASDVLIGNGLNLVVGNLVVIDFGTCGHRLPIHQLHV